MNKLLKRVLIGLGCLLLAVGLLVGGYLLYVILQYSRTPDNSYLPSANPPAQQLRAGQDYTALTFNIGFGAYDHAFSFFLDEGVMADGTRVVGQHSRAASAEVVLANTTGAAATAAALEPDFALFQEVDWDSHRSWKQHQQTLLGAAFPGYGAVYAENFHSAYLAYPFGRPIGRSNSGLYTLCRYNFTSPVWRSLPVDDSFPTRFFDLDRGFTQLRLPVEGAEGELVLINLHLSAFDEGGVIRAAQLEVLAGVLAQEREKGNWVVAGGDFNHALCGTVEAFPSQQQVPQWVAVFDAAALPEGFGVVCAGNAAGVPTCRSSDIAYQPGVNYTAVLDGFVVSDNVSATAENIDAGFENSDHNPVLLRFVLEG